MGDVMKDYNLIVVFNKEKDKSLFCIRANEPFKGMYNFVGGKIEAGENFEEAAYRELYEETGISRDQISLEHFMDLNYYTYGNNIQVYYGILHNQVALREEKNKLEWVDIDEKMLDTTMFAGNYNIPHIIKQIKVFMEE